MPGRYAKLQLMTSSENQTEFKSSVKKWLKSHHLDYRWVAEQCGVSEITVRNWMSQKNIPPLKKALLQKVMVQMPSSVSGMTGCSVPGMAVNASLSFTIQLSTDLYARLEQKALASQLTIEELVGQTIVKLVENENDDTPSFMRSRKIILPSS